MSNDDDSRELIIPLEDLGTEKMARQEGEFFAKQDEEDVRKKRLLNDSLAQDNDLRLDYAQKAYGLVQAWVGFVIVLVSAQFGLKGFGYALGREEFIAVVVSLSASVFGFWALVGRYLFPSSDKLQDKK